MLFWTFLLLWTGFNINVHQFDNHLQFAHCNRVLFDSQSNYISVSKFRWTSTGSGTISLLIENTRSDQDTSLDVSTSICSEWSQRTVPYSTLLLHCRVVYFMFTLAAYRCLFEWHEILCLLNTFKIFGMIELITEWNSWWHRLYRVRKIDKTCFGPKVN